MNGHIPFDQIAAVSLAQAHRLLGDWFPNGRVVGHEFKVGNIAGDPGESLSVNLNTGKWSDFAAGIGGPDLIGVRAAMRHGSDRTAAARELGPMLGIRMNGHDTSGAAPGSQKKHKNADDWHPIVPPPTGAPPPGKREFEGFSQVYDYLNAAGDRALFYIRRREARNGEAKLFIPLTFGELNGQLGWHAKAPATPRPLYGLDRLAAAPDATVIITEGEKACLAAQRLFPDYVCVTWAGGAKATEHADLTPLRDRQIIIWPDNDADGHRAASALRDALPLRNGQQARILQVSDLPEGHDAADVSLDDPEAWLAERLVEAGTHEQHSTDDDDPLGIWDAGDDDYIIPPREWLLGNTFCKKFLSSLIADGGVGKTALRIAQIGSLATGRSLTGEHVFRRCRALILSFEDDKEELRRRVYSAMLKHGITQADLKGYLFLAAPKGLKLAQMVEGSPEIGALDKMLRNAITRRKLDIVCLDPFVKTHAMNENDNNAIDFVCGLLAEIAIDLNCAMDVPHHTNKGLATAGDANKGRGATAAKDAARLVYTLTPMTPEEGKMLGLDEGDRRFLVRYDSAKVNIAPPSIQAKWFRIIGMPLGNFTETYPAGDNVQSVEPWTPPDTWAGLDATLLNSILDAIDRGMENGQRYSAANAAGKRAAWLVVQAMAPDKSEKQCRAVIATWMKSETLTTEDYEDSVERKTRTGLRVALSKRP